MQRATPKEQFQVNPISTNPDNGRPRGNMQKLMQPIRRQLKAIPTPVDLFSGLKVADSLAPDNIIFFERTDIEAFRPEGVRNNFHHRFELVVALEGRGPVRIGDNTYKFEPSDCALIFPNQFHHYMDVQANRLDWLFVTFELRDAGMIQALQDSPRRLDAEGVLYLQNTILPYVSSDGRETVDTLEISYFLSRFLRHMGDLPNLPESRCNIHKSEDIRDVLLEQINHYIRTHLSEAQNISQLAEALGYSVSHLRSVFRDRLGVSLGRYIRESRLSEAAKLLQTTDLSVTEISKRAGFDSLFAFSRAFKVAYGIPPKAYSKMVQK